MKILLCFLWIVTLKTIRLLLDVSLFLIFLLPMVIYYAYRYHLTGRFLRGNWNAWRPTTFLNDTLGAVIRQNWREAEQMAGKWDNTEDRSEHTLLRGSRQKQGVL